MLKRIKTQNGDLQITLLRSPLQIRRDRDTFDWKVKIELHNGGLIEENDPYPNWAPENGYQQLIEASMSSNNIPWSAEMNRNFYFKNAQGQFGRIFL